MDPILLKKFFKLPKLTSPWIKHKQLLEVNAVAGLLDFGTRIFLRILQKYLEHLFHRTLPDSCF